MWLGVRKLCNPRICAARVRLAPLGRRINTTGTSAVRAMSQALARSVPFTPS